MGADVNACRDGGGVKTLGVVLRKKCLDDVISREMGGEGGVGIAEDENIGVGAQLIADGTDGDCLVDTGDGEEATALLEKYFDACGSTVTVRLGFYNGDDMGIGGMYTDSVFDGMVVIAQGREIDLGVIFLLFEVAERRIELIGAIHRRILLF
jgi:hypothetical protein